FLGHLLDRFDLEFFRVTLTTHGTSYLGLIMRLGGVYETRGDSVAARVHLPVYYQVQLIRSLLADGESNKIKQFVVRLFVHRMKTAVVVKELMAAKCSYPNAVSIMAYYYSSLKRVRCRTEKDSLVMLRGFRICGV
ncbi:hypothetical protein, partial [Pseudomonas mosselii]|uniref:hypothetical protein n=1 Tax=Pseudomonas mosselii TaxID=78327 RepID=UPI001C70CAD4